MPLIALDSRTKRGMLPDGAFRGQGRAYMTDEARIGSAAGQEVGACRRQTQPAVGTAAHYVCVRLILSIVEPPAHRAKLKGSRSIERPASAAEAAHIRGLHTALDDSCRAELRKLVVKIL
jgi:hypothetical protein